MVKRRSRFTKVLFRFWNKGWVSFFVSALSLGWLLSFTWLKWGDLIVDAGRGMYVPWQIFLGKILYKDINYLYGPFSPYFNAFLFKLFGATIYSLVLSGVITICAVSALIYKISRIFLDIFSSTFAALTFLFVFAFGHYVYYGNYNYIIPYSYPVIHGIALAFLALYCFYLDFFVNKKRCAFLYVIFLLGTFLCRIEIAVFVILSIAICLIIYFVSRKGGLREVFLKASVYLIAPLACAVFLYSLFFALSGKAVFKASMIDMALANMNLESPFTRWLSGGIDLSGNLQVIFKTFFYYMFFCVFFTAGGFILSYASGFRKIFSRVLWYLSIGLIFILSSFFIFERLFTSHDLQYRPIPLICLAVIFISTWKFIKSKNRADRKYLFLIGLSIFSLLLMSRMLFYVWAGHYGFYIMIPGLIVYYIFFFAILPERLNPAPVKGFFRLAFMFIFILFIIGHSNISNFCYRNRTLKIDSSKGALYVFNTDREVRCKELIDFLKRHRKAGETLVVFPEGLGINFFSGMENPLYFNIYLPLDLVEEEIVDRIISEMENKAVDYVALIQRSVTEYGHRVFGRDYAGKIMEYVRKNYILHKQFGPFPFTSEEYGIALFKKKI